MAQQRETLAERAAEALLARIRSGEWAVGDKLPGETTLGPQLGVGRSTVREATRLLAARGILQPKHGSGVYLAALDAADDWDAILRRASQISVLEVRIAIESEAAELAAERRTDEDLSELRRLLTRLNRARGDREREVTAELEFHRAAVAAAKNPIMLQLYDGFTPQMGIAIAESYTGATRAERDPADDPHLRLVDRMEARDSAGASRVIRSHLEALKAAAQAAD